MTTETTTELEEALDEYIRAKRAEDAATARRLTAEKRILELHPLQREEGATSFAAGDYKVTLTGSINYKCDDIEALAAACRHWPAERVPLKSRTELDPTGLKWLRANDPKAWYELAKFVSTKPAKTSVKVSL